ncbi:MAG TPA: tRNA (adenosine(37)-N6)-threonylcarbamoyltransferase complex ATPase subunit type 1 TsaE [Flavobacterium sp.]|nr:tRNA (adenosine(37)-N6)-threonylcarbamoyltransferase complex ATPase subunit type 1 TsaE [Flavobacterium sp.]
MEIVFSLAEIDEIAKKILTLNKYKIILFEGEMGAGKTTLTKALAKCLGVQDMTSSPTFSLVNEYESADGLLYHFDLFRLKDLSEAYDIGIDEYLDSGNYCFIEWPEEIMPILTDYHQIQLTIVDAETRRLKFL